MRTARMRDEPTKELLLKLAEVHGSSTSPGSAQAPLGPDSIVVRFYTMIEPPPVW
jgi:hypothetical protein